MNIQSMKYAAALTAAVVVPYQVVKDGRAPERPIPVTRWWDSLWESDGGPAADAGFTVLPERVPERWNRNEPPPADPRAVRGTLAPDSATTPRDQASINSAQIRYRQISADVSPQIPTGPQFQSLVEILRFDIQPGWLMRQFPQVWKLPGWTNEVGYRVTLVSGTRLTDIAGALTYTFDRQQVLQRIQLEGQTGDPSELLAVASQYYGMKSEPDLGTSILVSRDAEKQPISILRIQPNSLIRQSQPFRRFQVALELNRPSPQGVLSEVWQNIPGIATPGHVERNQLPMSDSVRQESTNQDRRTEHRKKAVDDPSTGRPRRPNTDRLIPHSR